MVAEALGRRVVPQGSPADERAPSAAPADLSAVYEAHFRYVWRCLRSLGVHDAHLDDALQDVFIVAARKLADFDGGAELRTWLYAIARNAIVDRMRARHEPPAEVPDLASSEPGPSDQAESSFVSWRVHRALEELPDKEREVVELAYWSGLSQSEVAEFLHIPLGTVKTRTRSALSRLAGVLEGEELA